MGGRIWPESEVGKGSTFHFNAWFGLTAQRSPLARQEAHAGVCAVTVAGGREQGGDGGRPAGRAVC